MINEVEIEKEVRNYASVANNVVGFVLITFSLAIISISNTKVQLVIWIFLIPAMIPFMQHMFREYPKTILALRDGMTDEQYSIEERVEFERLYTLAMKKHLNWKVAFTKSFLYVYGFIFYGSTFFYILDQLN